MQDDRQDYQKNAREDRQEFAENQFDERAEWYDDRWRFAVGASLTAATFSSLSCVSTTVIVGGVTYHRCDNSWYSRAYSGGNVTYIVVNAPAGY